MIYEGILPVCISSHTLAPAYISNNTLETVRVPNKKPLSPKELKGLLITAGVSQIEIAETTKKSPQAVSQVVANKRTSKTIRTEIAKRLGMQVSQIWADNFGPGRWPRAK